MSRATKLRPVRAERFVLRLNTGLEYRKLTTFAFTTDGSFWAGVPYFRAGPGLLAELTMEAGVVGPVDLSLAESGRVTINKVKSAGARTSRRSKGEGFEQGRQRGSDYPASLPRRPESICLAKDRNPQMAVKMKRKQHAREVRFMPTARDRSIVLLTSAVGIVTREHIQRLLFGPGGRTRCQERLALLVRHRYLDTFPRRSVNAPLVYHLSRRCVNGNRLLRATGRGHEVRSKRVPLARLQHTLDIVGCRIQVLRACEETRFSLISWLDEEELAGLMARDGIVPDAYFQLSRRTPDGERRSSFFLEVERSGKSERALIEKMRNYGKLYYGGRFQELFRTAALRVLVLVGSDYGIRPDQQVGRFATLAGELGVTFLRFARLDWFVDAPSGRVLLDRHWRKPQDEELAPLFESEEATKASSDGGDHG
jgi:hypothetical protein